MNLKRNIFTLFFCICTVLFVWPGRALAIQIHSGPEGLYVHQISHIFFMVAMAFILYFLSRHPLGHGKAWVYLKLSFLFFLVWNINAFITHWLESNIPEEAFARRDILPLYLNPPITFARWVYYAGKFDHVLCVPAMFFLVMALKTFYRDAWLRSGIGKDMYE
ncbi:MAG: hypothetical protein M0022_03525 [Desulfobacteraceae bacterium]|nr:hypothetical protein [Desulfobacteraceae bacterium]